MRSIFVRRAGRSALAALFLLVSASWVQAAVTANWNPNSESDIAGYVLHWGTTTQRYTSNIDVGNTTSWTLSLAPGQYYFAVRAYDTSGLFSPYSAEVAFTVVDSGVGAVSIIAPSGTVSRTPAYQWNPIANASWYLLRVEDVSGVRINEWYTASQLGCGGSGTCSITPSVQLAIGAAQAAVQTYSDSTGYGSWSSVKFFTVGGSGTPGPLTMTAPTGTITTRQPTYSWTAHPSASWYLLNVQDGSGLTVNQWYTASQVGCGGGSGTCSVTPAVSLVNGAAIAAVLNYSDAAGNGSWSPVLSFTVNASGSGGGGGGGVPGVVSVTQPTGTISSSRPTYAWSAESASTWYLLWVEDVNGVRINQWYTAAQAGCASGSGSCSITPGISLADGPAQAWVQPYGESYGYGSWSSPSNFTVR